MRGIAAWTCLALAALLFVAVGCQSPAPQLTPTATIEPQPTKPTATTELQPTEHKAAIHEAMCTLVYEKEGSTTIRVAASGAAQAPGDQGVNIYFRLNGGDDEFEFDEVAATSWSQLTLTTSGSPPGRPLARVSGEPDATGWRGIWQRVAEARLDALRVDLLVTRYDPGSSSMIILAFASFECPDKQQTVASLGEQIISQLQATATPTPRAVTTTKTPSPTTTPVLTPIRVPTATPTPTSTATPALRPVATPTPTQDTVADRLARSCKEEQEESGRELCRRLGYGDLLPTPLLTPTPAPTSTPKPVVIGPQLLLPIEMFPLPGYRAKEPEALGGDNWRRQFDSDDVTLRGYYWLVIDIAPTATPGDQFVKAQACGGAPTERVSEVSAPPAGDAVKGCVYERADGIRTFKLFTATRNVGLRIQAATDNPGISNAAVMEVMASLANLQIALIDQLSPAGPTMTVTTGTPKFQFNPPATLPAADPGKPYQPNGQPFSFCDPPTIGFTTQCPPPGTVARNPSGGNGPYHFQYGTLGGFPPFGLSLGKDGQLTGTPHPSTAGKTYRFTVCAIDLKGDYVCREVSITVTGAAPTPTLPLPTPTPRPTATPTPVPTSASFAITSASCRYLRSNGPVDREYEVLVSGTASGPVGALLVMPSLSGYIRLSWSSAWGDGSGTSRYAERQPGQPDSTAWTATLVIGSGPSKTMTVDGYVTAGTTKMSDSRTLTCQSP